MMHCFLCYRPGIYDRLREGPATAQCIVPSDKEARLVIETVQSITQAWTRNSGAQSSLFKKIAQRLLGGGIA